MDNISFYQPTSALRNQCLRFPGTVTASHVPRGFIASPPAWKITTAVRTQSQKTPTSDLYCRTEHDSTASRDPPNHDSNGDHSNNNFPDLEELLLGTQQKSLPTSADPSADNYNGFIDIDELPPDMEQRGVRSAHPDCSGSAAYTVDNGTRVGSPTDSSRSTEGSSQDPIILSDSNNEFAVTESETSYSDLDVNVTAKMDWDPPHIAESDMADDEGFGPRTTNMSDLLVADYEVDDNDSNIVDVTRPQLAADLPMSANPGHESVTAQVCRVWASTDVTEGSKSLQDLDVTKEAEDEGIDVLANDEANSNTLSGSPTISRKTYMPKYSIALSDELQGSRHDPTPSPQLDPAIASLEQSDSNNGPRPRPCRRRDTKRVRRERLLMQAHTGPARSASPVSAALESGDECAQPVAQLVAPFQERGIADTDQKMADVGGTDDSNDEDYGDMSDAAASEMRGTRYRKRVKRARNREPSGVETPSNHSLNVSYQDCMTAVTSFVNMQESEEIPIRGFLTLKTIGSKVVYSLSFSQEPLPDLGGTSRRQGIPGSISEPLPVQELAVSGPVRTRYSTQEDELLLQLKGEGLSWDEISEHFPERSKATLQVRYSTKLKPRVGKIKDTRKRCTLV